MNPTTEPEITFPPQRNMSADADKVTIHPKK